jgi:Flp pilus assembly protein TadD
MTAAGTCRPAGVCLADAAGVLADQPANTGCAGSADPKAVELLTKARQTNPDDPGLTKALRVLNYRRGLYPQSVDLLERAVGKIKDDPELQFYLGMSYYQLKHPSEAEAALNRALSLKLSDKLAGEARRALGDCCQKAN